VSFDGSFLNRPLSRDFVWEVGVLSILVYLFFHPALSHPLSLAVALGGGLFLFLFRPIPIQSFSRLGISWFLFLLYLSLTSLGSLSPGLSWQSTAFLFLGTVLFLMASESSAQSKARLEGGGFFLALMAAGMGLYQIFFGYDQWAAEAPKLAGFDLRALYDAEKARRAFGPLATSGALAALLILFIPLGFIQWKNQSGSKKIIFFFSTGLLLAGLLATKSVGACLSLGSATILVLIYRRAWAWLAAAGGACLAAILLLLAARGFTHWEIGAFAARISLWRSAWSLFVAHPFFGCGTGTFDLAYQQSGMPLAQGARFAHNLALQVLVENGLVGLGLGVGALISILRRLKAPPRWEGWGIATGALAFFIFSFFDLPLQMPELVWIFALVLGRLELAPAKVFAGLKPSGLWIEMGLLGVLLISGFWPPFRPWDWALLAGAFWIAAAFERRGFDKIPLWIFGGGLFILGRALSSPSAVGALRFLEMAGLALVFVLVLGSRKDPAGFLKRFCVLGLAWALGLWIYSFQSPDMKDWKIFPNPKQVEIFLLPLIFLSVKSPWRAKGFWKSVLNPVSGLKPKFIFIFSAATLWLLRSFSSVLGFLAGSVYSMPRKYHRWVLAGGLLLMGAALVIRAVVFSGTDQGDTQWDRLSIWNSAVKVWAQEPLLGVGPGVFDGDYQRFKEPRISGVSRYQMDAEAVHNEPLDWLTAFGLVGFVFALLLLRRFWPRGSSSAKGAALTALGTASLFDFCFHTPLIVLQAAGLLAPEQKQKPSYSWPAGFLALGLTLGLFGAAAWVPSLMNQAQTFQAVGQFPQALQSLDTAVRLNAWDARVQGARADFLENLYLTTGDENWKNRSDESFYSGMNLERADGQWSEKNARRLSTRFEKNPTQDSLSSAGAAWVLARAASPTNAFVYFDEGLFFERVGQSAFPHDKLIWETRARMDFQKAAELEPNYASAWVNLGYCQKQNPATRSAARDSFKKALEVYGQWKDDGRMDPLEKQMVSLPPVMISALRKEVSTP